MTSPKVTRDFARFHIRPASQGHDSLEVRADLLEVSGDVSNVRDQVVRALSTLRRFGTSLPFIFTVRTKEEGGYFSGSDEQLLALYAAGIGFGCEVLDLGYVSDDVKVKVLQMIRGSNTRLISSAHIVGKTVDAYTDRELDLWFHDCLVPPTSCADSFASYVVCVKVVGRASSMTCALRVHAAAKRFQISRSTQERNLSVVALCTDVGGYMSRVMNTFTGFTPVCHPVMPAKAAPGQLTKTEILEYLDDFSGTRAKYYYLFGSPIYGSPSPTLHNTGFDASGFSGAYFRCDTLDVERVRNEIKRPTFMGASVTIPFKRDVMQFVDTFTKHAQDIGAVNTLMRQSDGKIVGDNTDWIGIRDALFKDSMDVDRGDSTALILGAGGTSAAACYRMRSMGFGKIYVYNRTFEKAVDVAGRFGAVAISSLDDIDGVVSVVVGTVPASAKLTVPDCILDSDTVVLDAAYTPRITALLKQALSKGCRICSGIDMLIAQGIAQFDMWVGESDDAVHKAMARKANAYYAARRFVSEAQIIYFDLKYFCRIMINVTRNHILRLFC